MPCKPEQFDCPYQKMKADTGFLDRLYKYFTPLGTRYFNIRIHNEERIKQLNNTGFILLPKHQSGVDHILEGYLIHKNRDDYGWFMAREKLPIIERWAHRMRVYRIHRAQDLPKRKENGTLAENQPDVESGKQLRDRSYDFTTYLASKGEVAVVHIEGTRNLRKETKLTKGHVTNLLRMQERTRTSPVYVPLDIKYAKSRRNTSPAITPRKRIDITVGETFQTNNPDEFIDHLVRNVELFTS